MLSILLLREGRCFQSFHTAWVESGCGAVAVGSAYLFPPLSSGGASLAEPWLRFHTPLIEPDVQMANFWMALSRTCLLSHRFCPLHPQLQTFLAVPSEVRTW